jgi:hypothetical protein
MWNGLKSLFRSVTPEVASSILVAPASIIEGLAHQANPFFIGRAHALIHYSGFPCWFQGYEIGVELASKII